MELQNTYTHKLPILKMHLLILLSNASGYLKIQNSIKSSLSHLYTKQIHVSFHHVKQTNCFMSSFQQDVPMFIEMMQKKIHTLKNAPPQSALLTPINRYLPSTMRRERMPSPLVSLATSKASYHNPTPGRNASLSTTPQNQPYQPMIVRSCPKNFPTNLQQSNLPSRTFQQINLTPGIVKRQVDSNSRVGVQPPRTVTHPTRLGIQTPRMIPQSPRVVSPEVDVSPRVVAQQRDIERRSQLLSRIPSPPPLTPLPGPSPAVKRGFKTPFAIGRDGRAGDGASSLRKRLRDELEEESESPSKLQCVHHGEIGKDNDSDSRVPGKSKDDAQTCKNTG